ncbi:hypothetical protein OG948_00965 [Embleya sp. NBC_00888]|uniref:hypothetical protein n=1 Tax=Embleya sp. NBC_00888 TaxID=2975960 RepID=UPI00386F332B|nr:hypothetical protein OG948_00965 [Embleya sp. NBC_00888]
MAFSLAAFRRQPIDTTSAALFSLLEGAAPEHVDAALRRWSDTLRRDLSIAALIGLPDTVADWFVRYGSATERMAVAARDDTTGRTLALLGDDPDPLVREAVFAHDGVPASLRRRILAAGPSPGLRTRLLKGAARHAWLGPMLDCPDPELAAYAREYLRGAAVRPDNAPESLFAALAATDGFLESERIPSMVRLEDWTPDHWAELARLHRAQPLGDHACRALVGEPGCPRTTALALIAYGRSRLLDTRTARTALGAGTVRLEDLVQSAPRAADVIVLIGDLRDETNPEGPAVRPAALAALDDLLTDRIRAYLGTVPELWRAAADLLLAGQPFAGSICDLLAAAVRNPTAPPVPLGPTPLRSPLVGLLAALDPTAADPVVAALGPTALVELARCGLKVPIAPPIVDAIIRTLAATSTELLCEFTRHHVHPEVGRRLRELDDPQVNAAMLGRGVLAGHVYTALLSGAPHGEGRGTPVPLLPGVTDSLRTLLAGGKTTLPYVFHSSTARYAVSVRDADLVVRALTAPVEPLGIAFRIAGCRRLALLDRLDLLAELAVGDEVLGDETAKTVRAALAAHPASPGGVVRDLEAFGCRHLLATASVRTLGSTRAHVESGLPVPWEAIRERLIRGELDLPNLAVLADHPRIPETVALAMIEARPNDCFPKLGHRSRTLGLAALRIDRPNYTWERLGIVDGASWDHCLREGVITPAEFLDQGRSARRILSTVNAVPGRFAPVRLLLRGLVERYLADDADAWAATAWLLPDFPGSVTELLTTARAAAASAAGHPR